MHPIPDPVTIALTALPDEAKASLTSVDSNPGYAIYPAKASTSLYRLSAQRVNTWLCTLANTIFGVVWKIPK